MNAVLNDAPSALDEALDRYLAHLRVERGLLPATLESYARDLREYLEQGARSDTSTRDELIKEAGRIGPWLPEADRTRVLKLARTTSDGEAAATALARLAFGGAVTAATPIMSEALSAAARISASGPQ